MQIRYGWSFYSYLLAMNGRLGWRRWKYRPNSFSALVFFLPYRQRNLIDLPYLSHGYSITVPSTISALSILLIYYVYNSITIRDKTKLQPSQGKSSFMSLGGITVDRKPPPQMIGIFLPSPLRPQWEISFQRSDTQIPPATVIASSHLCIQYP